MPNVMKITDENGTVVATREYDAFGTVLSETGAWSRSRFGFHPNWIQLKDGDGKFYITPGGRIYDTETGRFLQRDPKAKPGADRYVAFRNNPVRYVDPDGRDPQDKHSGIPEDDIVSPVVPYPTEEIEDIPLPPSVPEVDSILDIPLGVFGYSPLLPIAYIYVRRATIGGKKVNTAYLGIETKIGKGGTSTFKEYHFAAKGYDPSKSSGSLAPICCNVDAEMEVTTKRNNRLAVLTSPDVVRIVAGQRKAKEVVRAAERFKADVDAGRIRYNAVTNNCWHFIPEMLDKTGFARSGLLLGEFNVQMSPALGFKRLQSAKVSNPQWDKICRNWQSNLGFERVWDRMKAMMSPALSEKTYAEAEKTLNQREKQALDRLRKERGFWSGRRSTRATIELLLPK